MKEPPRWRALAAIPFALIAALIAVVMFPIGWIVSFVSRTAIQIHGAPIPGLSDWLLWWEGSCRRCRRPGDTELAP